MSKHLNASSLSSTVSKFAHAVAGLGVFLLIPLLEQHVRHLIYGYFIGSFTHDIALWASWGFIAVLAICGFFGGSAIFQIAVQMVLRRAARRTIL